MEIYGNIASVSWIFMQIIVFPERALLPLIGLIARSLAGRAKVGYVTEERAVPNRGRAQV